MKEDNNANIDNMNLESKSTGSKNVLWGALFLIGAVALLVNKLGFLNILLGGMSFFQIVITVFLVGALVKGMANHSFGQILFSVALIIIVNDKVLHMEAFTPWTVLGAALLGTIGLHLMFPGVRSKRGRLMIVDGKEMTMVPISEGRRNGSSLYYRTCFGQSVKYASGVVGRVKLENAFGAMQVYFTDTQLEKGMAEVILENAFGGTTLYVPANWRVIIDVTNVCSVVNEQGKCNPEDSQVLYVKGDIAFGRLQIRYI